MNLIWKTEYEPANPNQIRIVEDRLGVLFPDDFIRVVTNYQGGRPSKSLLIVAEIGEVYFDNKQA